MKHVLRFLTLFVIAALAAAFLAAPALAAPAPAPSERILPAILASVDTEDLMPDMEPLLEQSELPESNSRGGDSDWTKVLYGDGYRLIKYNGEETEIVVPSEIDGKPVVSLYQTFQRNETVVSVTLPDTVTEIGYCAFYGCTALQEVTLSDGVTEIGYCAFSGCTALQEVTLPVSVTKLDYGAFSGCTTLASVTGGAITSLGIYAFNNCSALTEAPTFPDGLTEIPYGAFFGCSSLTSVTGGALTSLGELAFCECYALTEGPTLAEGLTEIPYGAFYGCSSLTSVTGGALTSLGELAFYECYALTEGPTLAEGLTSIPQAAFYGCEALQELTIPCSVQTIGEAAVYGCAALTEIELPDGLETIGEQAFNWCTGLATIDVPDSVTEIGDHAFYPSTTLIVGQGSYAQQWATANSQACTVRGSADLSQEIAPDATTVSAKADAIVATLVSDGMSDYEKALVLHDYLILHTRYVDTHDDYCHTAEAVLLDGYGVCQGYTYAYEALLTRAGITCTTQSGYDHIWNMALLGGEWVHIDCTWDDPVVNGNPELHGENHTYFGITNYALEGIDHHECYDERPVATSIEQSYAWMTGLLPEKIEELEATIAELVAAGDFHGTVSAPFGGETRSVGLSGDGSGIMGRMTFQGVSDPKATPKAKLSINSLSRLIWKNHVVKLTKMLYDSQKRRMSFDAYAHVPDIDTLVLPHDLTDLQSESFVGSPTDRVILPDALETVGDDVFKNVYAVLEAPENSFALEYAKNSGLPWQVRPAEEEAVS